MRKSVVFLMAVSLSCTGSDEGADATAPLTEDGSAGDAAATDEIAETATDPPPVPPFESGDGDHAGVAVVDITPTITETYIDHNGNWMFDGCRYDPEAKEDGCDEPFDDANGNGEFDPVFIAGFGELRPARAVHDPIEVRALVLARGAQYLALVSLDLVGIGLDRTNAARQLLEAKGWDPDRIIIASSHNHAGPDVRGLWGDPEPGQIWPGADPDYNAQVSAAIAQAVEMAADSVVPVSIRMGMKSMRDVNEWFNGRHFDGKNPTDKMLGLIADIRDPVIVSDAVFALQAVDAAGDTVATLVNWSGHPEVTGDEHDQLSADWVFYMRSRIEEKLGGKALFLPECLGGMMSTLGGHIPLVEPDGTWKMEANAAGVQEPVMTKALGFEFARANGTHVADAALMALDDGEAVTLDPFEVRVAPLNVPIDNGAFRLLFELGLFDIAPGLAVQDPALCPEYSPDDALNPGCVPNQTWMVKLGPAAFSTAPGEVLPEIFHGLPTHDPRWALESQNAGLRGTEEGRDSVYFPQHPKACDGVVWAQCSDLEFVNACQCTRMHEVPYRIASDSAVVPLKELLDGKYRFLVGNAGDHLGYIIPDSDFHTGVGLFADYGDADHYEETVSASFRFAVKLWEAQFGLAP